MGAFLLGCAQSCASHLELRLSYQRFPLEKFVDPFVAAMEFVAHMATPLVHVHVGHASFQGWILQAC